MYMYKSYMYIYIYRYLYTYTYIYIYADGERCDDDDESFVLFSLLQLFHLRCVNTSRSRQGWAPKSQ